MRECYIGLLEDNVVGRWMLRFFLALYCRTDDMWYAEDRLVRFYSYFLAVVFLLIDHHPLLSGPGTNQKSVRISEHPRPRRAHYFRLRHASGGSQPARGILCCHNTLDGGRDESAWARRVVRFFCLLSDTPEILYSLVFSVKSHTDLCCPLYLCRFPEQRMTRMEALKGAS